MTSVGFPISHILSWGIQEIEGNGKGQAMYFATWQHEMDPHAEELEAYGNRWQIYVCIYIYHPESVGNIFCIFLRVAVRRF